MEKCRGIKTTSPKNKKMGDVEIQFDPDKIESKKTGWDDNYSFDILRVIEALKDKNLHRESE